MRFYARHPRNRLRHFPCEAKDSLRSLPPSAPVLPAGRTGSGAADGHGRLELRGRSRFRRLAVQRRQEGLQRPAGKEEENAQALSGARNASRLFGSTSSPAPLATGEWGTRGTATGGHHSRFSQPATEAAGQLDHHRPRTTGRRGGTTSHPDPIIHGQPRSSRHVRRTP